MMIVLNEAGAMKLQFHNDWFQEAKRIGLRDPFKVSQMIFAKRVRQLPNGSMEVDIPDEPDPDEPTKEEKSKYIQARDAYIATRMFDEVGYEAFEIEVRNSYKDHLRPMLDRMFPCYSATGQCSLFCPKYKECNNEVLD